MYFFFSVVDFARRLSAYRSQPEAPRIPEIIIIVHLDIKGRSEFQLFRARETIAVTRYIIGIAVRAVVFNRHRGLKFTVG